MLNGYGGMESILKKEGEKLFLKKFILLKMVCEKGKGMVQETLKEIHIIPMCLSIVLKMWNTFVATATAVQIFVKMWPLVKRL